MTLRPRIQKTHYLTNRRKTSIENAPELTRVNGHKTFPSALMIKIFAVILFGNDCADMRLNHYIPIVSKASKYNQGAITRRETRKVNWNCIFVVFSICTWPDLTQLRLSPPRSIVIRFSTFRGRWKALKIAGSVSHNELMINLQAYRITDRLTRRGL